MHETSEFPRVAVTRLRAFLGSPASITEARRFITAFLRNWPCVDDAELIVSELATNAVRHSDSGQAHDDRGLKHRAEDEGRPVPIPPEPVAILREHLNESGAHEDGRLFRTSRGGVISIGTYCEAWKAARAFALTPEQQASPLAARPYDLRHAAVSLWLNAGVAAPTWPRGRGMGWMCGSRSTPSASTGAWRPPTDGWTTHSRHDRGCAQGDSFTTGSFVRVKGVRDSIALISARTMAPVPVHGSGVFSLFGGHVAGLAPEENRTASACGRSVLF
ncbi:hypothetical protein AB0B56_36975 [Streptosporangium canum]|uniref:hypothetical protein n=1 Tax=Streptosporangium canum TaxID=324952 RepID=UPI0034470FD5